MSKRRGAVVIERHANLVADGRPRAADVVGLPERGDLGEQGGFEHIELGRGQGDAVEAFEQVGDAAALEHDGAPGDFGGVRGEDGGDADAAEQLEGFGEGCAGGMQGAERAAKRAALDDVRFGERTGQAAAFAVVGFGKVDELEVEAEGARELVGADRVFDVACELRQVVGAGLAPRDGGLAQRFDLFIDAGLRLLANDLAEQGAEGADVAAQGRGFPVGGGGEEFLEAFGPGAGEPERRHRRLWHRAGGDRAARLMYTGATLSPRACVADVVQSGRGSAW